MVHFWKFEVESDSISLQGALKAIESFWLLIRTMWSHSESTQVCLCECACVCDEAILIHKKKKKKKKLEAKIGRKNGQEVRSIEKRRRQRN